MVDEYTREGCGFDIARSIGASRVKATLERLLVEHGCLGLIRSDNGKEFTSTELTGWPAREVRCDVAVQSLDPLNEVLINGGAAGFLR